MLKCRELLDNSIGYYQAKDILINLAKQAEKHACIDELYEEANIWMLLQEDLSTLEPEDNEIIGDDFLACICQMLCYCLAKEVPGVVITNCKKFMIITIGDFSVVI